MLSGHVAAAVLNTTRTKRSDKVWRWIDLHPQHPETKRQASGKEVMMTIAAMGPGEWTFAEGWSFERLMAE